ncbi:MAG: M23 family metallopeptidase [Lautropia sp.]
MNALLIALPMLLILVLVLVCVLVPLAQAWRVWRLEEPSLGAWALAAGEAAMLVALLALLGRWDIVGLRVRDGLLLLFTVSAAASAWRHRGQPWRADRSTAAIRAHATTLLSLLLLCITLGWVVAGLLPPANPRSLVLPLADGRFVVGQGGGNRLLNHHAPHRAQRYAADITAVDRAGWRARGLLPADPARYAIFGTAVVSPCDGAVVSARGDAPDLRPPQADRADPAGNRVTIACGDLLVELAHLQHRSVRVAAGDRVARGDLLGRVGNSGNSTEPHLHVHAVARDSGRGVPIAFDGRVPVRNRVYRGGAAAGSMAVPPRPNRC